MSSMTKKTKGSGNLTSISGGRNGGDNTLTPQENNQVIDFAAVRAKKNLESRRSVERFFLQNMVDAYCELDGGKHLLPLDMVEVSENGCSFRLSADKREELPMGTNGNPATLSVRLYFSRDSFLRVGFQMMNVNPEIGTGGTPKLRFGCKLDEAFASSDAYRQFAKFMESFTNHASRETKWVSTI
jgi:hypothetical protein